MQAEQEKNKALSAAALQISEQEARISHLEQQAAADKEAWRNEQENLSSMVNKVQEDIKEKDIHCSSLGQQLHQVHFKYYSSFLSFTNCLISYENSWLCYILPYVTVTCLSLLCIPNILCLGGQNT